MAAAAATSTTRKLNAWKRLLTTLKELIGDAPDVIASTIEAIAPTVIESSTNDQLDDQAATTDTAADTPDTAVANTDTRNPAVTQVAASASSIVGASETTGDAVAKEIDMCQIKDLAGRLIANARAPFKEEQRASLEALGLEALQQMDAAFSEPLPTPTPEPAPTPEPSPTPEPTPEPKALSRAEFFAQNPDIKAMVDGFQAHQAKVTGILVEQITAACRGAYTAEQLKAKPVAELQALHRALGLDITANPAAQTDFSLLGLATPPTTAAPNVRPVPDSWNMNGKKNAAAAS